MNYLQSFSYVKAKNPRSWTEATRQKRQIEQRMIAQTTKAYQEPQQNRKGRQKDWCLQSFKRPCSCSFIQKLNELYYKVYYTVLYNIILGNEVEVGRPQHRDGVLQTENRFLCLMNDDMCSRQCIKFDNVNLSRLVAL